MNEWSKEDEDACIDKHVRNLQTCAHNHGEPLGPRTARSIAFGMMLVEKHQKTTEQVLYDYIQARRIPAGILVSGEEAAKLKEEGVPYTPHEGALKWQASETTGMGIASFSEDAARALYLGRCGKLCTDPNDECFSESSVLPQYPCRLSKEHEGECLPKGNKR